jgi:polar amino acid transport system ATP-binding protein
MNVTNELPLIRVSNVRKLFHGVEVLKGISLDVRAGEKVFVIGPSGSGKSTLLRCINQLEEIDGGCIEIKGERLGFRHAGGRWVRLDDKEIRRQRAGIGMVFQRFNLFGHLTARENIVLAQRKVLGRTKKEAVESAYRQLKRVGLADRGHSYPAELSGGQQQRVAIARALAMDPEIMLFDEPTSSLDPELVNEVLDVIGKLASSGMTIIIVSHEIGFAKRAADTVYMLVEGSIVESGPPGQVIGNPQQERTRAFISQVM